jgi:uncharacterized protein YqgV (UPF0045/DUF77 family)
MIVSVEISYYPLADQYLQPIAKFIHNLNQYEHLLIRTTSMSTQVIGEYELVFEALKEEIKKSFTQPDSVFVMKIINADLTEIPKHD